MSGLRKRGCAYWLRLAGFGLVSFVVLGFVGYNVAWVLAVTRPVPSTPCCSTPADLGHEFEEVSFAGADGVTLQGWYIPGENGADVILLHGFGGNRAPMLIRAAMLADHSYGVLLYDRRATGESSGEWRTFGWADARDVSAALDYLASSADGEYRGAGVLGFSLGGQIALRAAADDERITAVVAEEPSFARASDIPRSPDLGVKWLTFLYWLDLPGLSLRTGEPMPPGVLHDLPDIAPRPVLYLSSGPEDGSSHWLVAHFYDHTPGPADLWSVPEAKHGAIPEQRPDEYEARIAAFFAQDDR
jgi:alpha-beta hydrolase superfamily lysophospholipase